MRLLMPDFLIYNLILKSYSFSGGGGGELPKYIIQFLVMAWEN